MFRFTPTATAHAALVAVAMALFAAPPAFAARPSDPHAPLQTASRAGDASDKGVSAEYASRAGDRQDGTNADA